MMQEFAIRLENRLASAENIHITDPFDLRKLTEFQTFQAQKIIKDLNAFIRKHEYRNKGKITFDEASAQRKALRKIVGEL